MTLINIWIALFTLFLFYSYFYCLREGLESATEYQSYNENDPLILGKQNAANIAFLKGQVDELNKLSPMITQINADISKLNEQVATMYQQQQGYASALNGDSSSLN
jgi:hypothetical protein